MTRQFIHTFISLLGQVADCAAYLIFGMLSYIYDFISLDIRWLLLCILCSFLSRYTAIASIIDWFYSSKKRESFLTNNSQSYLLYFLCQGTVAFSLIIRTQGELLDTSNVGLMLRIVLFMIHFSVFQIIIIANPLMNKKETSLLHSESSHHMIDMMTSYERQYSLNDDIDNDLYDNKFEVFKREAVLNHKTDQFFPYLVKIDNL